MGSSTLSSQEPTMANSNNSSFPIPASLQDLERAPYNLLPYPSDFCDDDESARADSFSALVHLLEQGNRTLSSGGLSLFQTSESDEDEDPWMDEDRVQALYTLVRKSSSLAPSTRSRLVSTLCQALKILSSILDTNEAEDQNEDFRESSEEYRTKVMPQSFRDAFGCHLYMLFSIMFFVESEAKVGNNMKAGSGKKSDKNAESEAMAATRAVCAEVMLVAAQSMARNRSKLWRRDVPDEAVVILPCRIAFQMLESATGVIARKASSADAAMSMIAATVESTDCVSGTIVAALMDLMHSYEHIAPLCAEICCMVSKNQTNNLPVELLREIGRLKTHGLAGGDAGGRASGIKNVAPFISHLAELCPRLVLSNIAHLMPHLNSEVYNLRSAIASAISNILSHPEGLKQITNKNTEVAEINERHDTTKTRGALLDVLTERVLDVSSFTRSAVLKAWIKIVQSGSLPVERFIPLTALAIDRLQDKTIMVRKQAMQVLVVVLENNPFMGDLDPERYRVKLKELYEFIQSNLPENIKGAHEAALHESQQSEADINELEQATLAAAIAEAEIFGESGEVLTEEQEFFRKKVQALKFTQAALDFIELFDDANESFQGMLLSANSSDVTEALRFFVRARHFKLPCATTGMKSALALMWSVEQTIRDEVRKAFIEVFIAEPGTDGKDPLQDNQIADNLLKLVGEASLSELASIEEAIISLVKEEKIPADVFLILWSVAATGSGAARAAAIQVISMGAGADKSIVDSKSRLKVLLDSGLGDYTEDHKNWKLACASAYALQRVERAVVDPNCAKYLVLDLLMEQLCAVARGDWCVDECKRDTLEWFAAAEESIKALFKISPHPERSCSEIIHGMYQTTFVQSEDSMCHSLRLARFFHVLGSISLNLLCYTEALSSSVRQANAKKTLQKQVAADQKKVKKSKCTSPTTKDSDSEDDIEAELGMAAEAEAENERQMAEITETEILGRGLINAFAPLLIRVVGNNSGQFHSEILMQASMLALCKFMCVSSAFCEKHLPLVFSALAKAAGGDTTMRANTVVALGDLAFRFPNEVEPYTPHLYACLRDSSVKVRRHTLMVLTHLILNDMVKVKGQVCEIALCLQDEDGRIRDMAGLLFYSLANRSNNPIYNLLPDIISQLSQLDLRTEEFRKIMSFLLGFIKKERQMQMLTEKLVLRMGKARTIAQKADLAYCICLLKHSEKSIKCLVDNFRVYKGALFDEDVKKSFFSVVSKTKKSAKPELKTILEEYENRLSESAEIGAEDAAASKRATKSKRKNKQTAKKKKKAVAETDEEGEECSLDKENARENANNSQRMSSRLAEAK